MEQTLFYVFGIALVVCALAVTALGLRFESFPPSRGALVGVITVFAALVGATATFAWMNASEEQDEHAAEHAEERAAAQEEASAELGVEEEAVSGEEPAPAEEPPPSGGGAGEALAVTSPTDGALVFDPAVLSAKAGEVTLEYENPSPVPHSIAIESGGETLAESETGADGLFTASAELEPGEYVFYCTVPGHREAGMEGMLTVE